jgi:predicted GNAT family acetyltransferase
VPIYSIEAPNGKIFKVEAPEGVSGEDVLRDFDTNLFPQWMAANKPKEQSIMGSLQAGLAQPLGALGTTAETLGLTGTGAALKSAAEYITPEGYESAAGRFITPQEGDVTLGGFGIGSLPAAVAEQSGQIAGAIGTRAAGAAIGAAAGSVVPIVGTAAGAIAGAFLGPFLFEALQILGPVAQERAQKEGRDTPNASDIGAAALTAAGSGALNAIGAKYLPGGGQAAAPLLKRMGEGLVGEGGTELLQSIIEQTGSSLGTEAGLDISGKQAIAEGILGGVAGGATSGAFGRRPEGPRPPTNYESLRADIEAARTPTEQDLTDILKGSQKTALPPPPPAAAEAEAAAAAAEEVSGAPSRPRLTVKQPVLEGGVPPTEAITSADLPPSIGAPTAANRPGVMGRAIEEPYVPQTEEEIRLQEQRQTMADTGMLPTVKTGPITREGRPVELRAEGAAAPLTPEIAIPMGAPPNKLDDFLKDTIKEPVSRLEGAPDEKALATIPRLKNWVAGNGGILLDKTTMGEYGKDVFRQGRAVFRTKYVAPSTAARMSNRVARPEEDVVKNAKESGWLGPAARARFNNGEAVTAEDTETFRALLSKDITSGPMDGVYEPDALDALAEKGPTKEALTEDTKRAVEGAIADAGYQNYPDEAYNDAVRRLVEGREDDPVVAVEKAMANNEKVSGERKDTARRTAADDLNRLVFTDKMPLDNEAMTFAYNKIINDPTLDPKATYTAALKMKENAKTQEVPFGSDFEFSRAGGKRKSKKAKAKARAAKTAAQQPPTPVVEPVKTITAEDKAAAMQRIDDAIKKLAGDDTDQGRNLAVALKRAIADRKISVDQVLQAFKMSETVMRLLSGVTGAQKIKFAANLFGTFPDPDNPGDFLADVEVGGTRSAYRQLIELSLNPDYNPLETTSHEIWHSLEDAFAASDRATGRIIDAAFKGATKIDEINPNLLRVLKNTRNPMVDGKVSLYDTLMSRDIDAAVAEETSQFRKERELKAYVFGLLDQARQNNVQIGGLGSAFTRFVNFVKSVRESVGNLLRGQGFTTVEEAFAGVSAGAAQRGLATGQKTSGPEFSQAKIVKQSVEPAPYIQEGSEKHTYVHPETGSNMSIITKPMFGKRDASVIDLNVPKEHQGKGIGKDLQERVLQDFPSLQGQVSSKAAAKIAYGLGRRLAGNEKASLEDIYKKIDKDSSVNMWTPEQAEFSRVKVPPNVANAPNAAGAQVNSTRWSNITDTVKEFFDPWAFIDNAPALRSFRNRLLGKIGTANELGQQIAGDIAKGSTADSGHNGNVYKFLTTRGASPSMIVDPEVRKAAVRAKEEINKQGKRLVDAGFMTQESLEKNYDQYVPRLYLYYEATERGMKTPNMGLSKQEYLKLRDDQLSVEERELLGEIKNPAFLAYVAIARPARDMALAQYFADIGTTSGVKWVLDDSVIDWRGKMVSPFWMASEIKLMKTVTLPLAEQTDPARAAIVRKEIASMQKLLDKIPGYGPESKIPDGYQRLPDTPRYGVLRGAVVQEGIYDDLVGTFAMVPNTNQSMIGKILGDEQSFLVNANKVWKLGKVTFNVPSQARNVISNIVALNVFGGIPLSRLPKALSAAAKSWSSKDQYWKDAQEYGIQGGTMAAAELKIMFNTMKQYQARGDKNNFFGAMATGRIAAKYLLSKPGEFYQNMEVLFKMALFIEGRKNGKTVSESVDAAHDSLFDYTMVNPNIRWLRNAPLGLPFITYYYKVLPKLIQTAREHPLRFAPYIMLSYALPQIAMAQLDWDDEDYEAARKSAADYMRDKGSMYILPWKDSNGKIQMVDLGYFFPWAAFTDPVVTAAWYGEPVKGLKQLGGQFVPGGPLITAIAVMATGRDPFTDKQVVNPLDTAANQFMSGLSYAWNQALPPMLNVDLNNMDNSGGAIPRIYNSLFSDGTGTDKRGMAKPDTLATAGRLFGFNITPLDVVKQRAQNINYMLNTIHKREAYRAQIAKDQSMTPEKRRAEIQDLNASIREDYLKIQKYATETARATKLED